MLQSKSGHGNEQIGKIISRYLFWYTEEIHSHEKTVLTLTIKKSSAKKMSSESIMTVRIICKISKQQTSCEIFVYHKKIDWWKKKKKEKF